MLSPNHASSLARILWLPGFVARSELKSMDRDTVCENVNYAAEGCESLVEHLCMYIHRYVD